VSAVTTSCPAEKRKDSLLGTAPGGSASNRWIQGANADRIYRTVREHLSPGDIVLLHENPGPRRTPSPGSSI
jgi:hypothetical protein